MSAEIVFHCRWEPAQVEITISARNDKGGLAVPVLRGNLLHGAVREKGRKHAYTRRIACEELSSECIHVIVRNWHVGLHFRPGKVRVHTGRRKSPAAGSGSGAILAVPDAHVLARRLDMVSIVILHA